MRERLIVENLQGAKNSTRTSFVGSRATLSKLALVNSATSPAKQLSTKQPKNSAITRKLSIIYYDLGGSIDTHASSEFEKGKMAKTHKANLVHTNP